MSLKELTAEKHRVAERSNFSKKMISGKMTAEEYSLYLFQMLKVYTVMETMANELGLVNSLKKLERTSALKEDLKELVGENHNLEYLSATYHYVKYLENLKEDLEVRKKLLAHMYVRYMGDLNGGQFIAKAVPGSGKFYQFEDKDRLVKQFSYYLKDDLADEANVAFDWNIKILHSLNHV